MLVTFKNETMFELPELPFSKDALGDWASVETLDYHHGKHHAGYVKKLNGAVLGTEFEGQSLDEVISGSRDRTPKVFNLAAQHFNHGFFWNCLAGESDGPKRSILEMINRDFESLDEFKEEFRLAAVSHFGSGWIWLVSRERKLEVVDYHDADTPAGTAVTPLLTLDVWEHAYYIDHRNDRGSFIEGFWKHVNWDWVAKQMR